MIGHLIKKYFSGMKNLMLVMGTIFLVLLFGITVFSKGLTYSVGLTSTEIVTDISNSDLTFNRVFNVLSGQSGEDLFAAVNGVVKNFTDFGNSIQDRLGTGVNRLITCAVIFGVIFVIGILIAYCTAYCVGLPDRKKRNIILTWLGSLLKCLIILALLAGCIMLTINAQTQNTGLILLALFPLLLCFLTLLLEWIFAGKSRSPFTKVVTVGHTAALLLVFIITIVITVVIAAALIYFFGLLSGVFLSLSLVILVFVTLSLNAYSFNLDNK